MFLEQHLCMLAGSTNKWKCFEHNCANFIDKMRKKIKYCSTLLLTTFQRWQNNRDLCGFNKLFPTKAFPDNKGLFEHLIVSWEEDTAGLPGEKSLLDIHKKGCISLRLIFWLYLVFFKVWNRGKRKGRIEKLSTFHSFHHFLLFTSSLRKTEYFNLRVISRSLSLWTLYPM